MFDAVGAKVGGIASAGGRVGEGGPGSGDLVRNVLERGQLRLPVHEHVQAVRLSHGPSQDPTALVR